MATKLCIDCGDIKDVNDFHFRSTKHNTRQDRCKACSKIRDDARYQAQKPEWQKRSRERMRAKRAQSTPPPESE